MSCTQTTNKYTETPQQRTRLIIKEKSHNCYSDWYQRKGKCFLQACASTLQCQSTTLLLLLLYAALQGYWGAVFNSLVYSFSWLQERSPNSPWTHPLMISPSHQAAPIQSTQLPAGSTNTPWFTPNTHEPCEDQPSPRPSSQDTLQFVLPLREAILWELWIPFSTNQVPMASPTPQAPVSSKWRGKSHWPNPT